MVAETPQQQHRIQRLDARSQFIAAVEHHQAGRLSEAVAAYWRTLASAPGEPAVWSNLGVALTALDRLGDALQAFEVAASLNPDFAPAYSGKGAVERELLRLNSAHASFQRALEIEPAYAEARCNLAVLQLLQGQLLEGWRNHEFRWEVDYGLASRRDFDAPLWLGEEDVSGKTILIHAEQGFGDTIQFCRYAPLLSGRGARVVLEAPRPLIPVLESLAGVSALVAEGDALPAFDLHCPLLSLPLAFRTTLESIPAQASYLNASSERLSLWRSLVPSTGRLKVGVVWSGDPRHRNDRNRSAPLRRFLPALPTDAEIFSLQKQHRPEDLELLAARGVHRFDEDLRDFGDAAALASLMDVVVCVDTAACHLAAALGRPTFVLLPRSPDWRWLLSRTDSPWYPTATLHRQPAFGDWESVARAVRADLERLAARSAQWGGGAP